MADDLVVIGRGRLIEQGPVAEFIDRYAQRWVRVRTPDPAPFADVLGGREGVGSAVGPDGIDVQGLPIERVGDLALEHNVVLHELSPQSESLEEAFLQATAGAQEYRSRPGRRCRRRDRAVMIDAVRSEWIKVSTLTVVKVLLAVAVAFPLVVVTLVAALGDSTTRSQDLIDIINAVSVLSAMLVGVVAAIGTTNEFSHGTIRPTFAAEPRRLVPMSAKLLVHVVLAAVVMVVILVASWVIGSNVADGSFPLRDDAFGNPLPTLPALIGAGLLGVGLAVLGFGLGLLIRNAPATICVLLLWPLIAESLFAVLFSALHQDDLVRFLPYVEGINMGSWDRGEDLLERVPGGLYFFAWVVVLTVLGLWRTQRADA